MKIFKHITIILFFFTATIYSQGKIILINGTSSAGKSSVSKELLKELGSDWQIVDADYLSGTPELEMRMKRIAIELIKKNFAEQLTAETEDRIIREDYSLAEENNFWLPREQYSTLENYFDEQLLVQTYKYANELSRTGKNIIIPTVFSADEKMEREINEFQGQNNILLILVYCPFEILSERINARNELAKRPDATAEQRSDKRPIFGVLNQFSKFYPFRFSTNTNMPVLEELTSDQVIRAWKPTDKDYELWGEEAKERIEAQRKIFYEEMLDNLGLRRGKAVTLVRPPYYYDVIVNNGNNTAQQCASEIKRFIQSGHEFTAFRRNVELYKPNWLLEKVKNIGGTIIKPLRQLFSYKDNKSIKLETYKGRNLNKFCRRLLV